MSPFGVVSAAVAACLCTSAAAESLSLSEATRLALRDQPQLEAQQALLLAARERVVSAGQLPDPVLIGGLSDLTLSGDDRYTLREEGDTQFSLGIRQAFLGGNKRTLRAQRAEREVERLQADLADQQRMVARETGMAWLAVWKTVRAQQLVAATRDESARQRASLEIGYRSGRSTQADLLAAQVALELEQDRLAGLQQSESHARNQLRRWLPADAGRPLDLQLPAFAAPDLQALLDSLDAHPHLAAQDGAVEVARAELDLARAATRPDWSAQVSYGHRPEFADYASIGFEMDLPLFAHQRQDREAAARAAELTRSEQARRDWLRQHRADLQLNVEDWRRLQQRLSSYDTAILPSAQARLDAALAAYRAGSGPFDAVLAARRAQLDLQLQRLDLEFDRAMHELALRYFDHAASHPKQTP